MINNNVEIILLNKNELCIKEEYYMLQIVKLLIVLESNRKREERN